ncbi:MAG: glycerophosphodiester phosphodiesterase, partial [bacterium]|nr:glycerophosphodiester phosphodiesterase [bacterium]
LCRGDGPNRIVREMTLAELKKWDCGSLRAPGFPDQQLVPGAKIPTFDEVLALADRGDFHFNIELKLSATNPQYTPSPEQFTRMVVEAVRRRGLEKRALIQSFDFRVLHAAGKIAPEIPLAALFSGRNEDFVTIAREAGARIVAPNFNPVTKEKVRQAQAAGLKVVPWTANTKEVWATLIAAGVDAIITDDPAGLIEHLKQKGLR